MFIGYLRLFLLIVFMIALVTVLAVNYSKMDEKINIILGVLFVELAIYSLFSLSLLAVAIYAYGAVVCFLKKKDVPVIVLASLLLLSDFILLLNSFNIWRILRLLSCATILLLSFKDKVPELKKYDDYVKKAWFVPAIVYFATLIIEYRFYWQFSISFVVALANVIIWILISSIYLLLARYIIFFKGDTKENQSIKELKEKIDNTINNDDYTIDIVKHILLLVFTFGIWKFIWIYRTTKFLNEDKDEEYRDPTTKLILCIFVPFYLVYWTYKTAQRIDRLLDKKNLQGDMTNICLIFSIIAPIIPPILLQEKINLIVSTKDEKVKKSKKTNKKEPEKEFDVVEQLKAYKELLDTGVITEEEFEKKKKELLK